MSTPNVLTIGNMTDRMLHQLAAHFTVHQMPNDRDGFIASHGAEIDYILVNGHGGVAAALMAQFPKLKVISSYGVGYDHVDAPAAAERGIVVTHTPTVLNDEVANTAIMLMLTTARNFVHDNAYLMRGDWAKHGEAPLATSVAGMTVGILGLGRIGMATAEKLAVFGVTVVYHGRSKQDVNYTYYPNLTDMARDCDILISIAPGGAATQGIINKDVINALGPKGMLINVGRGSVVDEPALIAALQDGRLGKAGLDVFATEPNPPAALLALENATLLPHVGSGTHETREAMGDLTVENLISHLKTGNTVTPVPECKDI